MSAAAAGGGASPFWRAAGMTYVAYANTCAALVRKCLKEPFKTQAATREQVHYKFVQWADGQPQKPVIRSTPSVGGAPAKD